MEQNRVGHYAMVLGVVCSIWHWRGCTNRPLVGGVALVRGLPNERQAQGYQTVMNNLDHRHQGADLNPHPLLQPQDLRDFDPNRILNASDVKHPNHPKNRPDRDKRTRSTQITSSNAGREREEGINGRSQHSPPQELNGS